MNRKERKHIAHIRKSRGYSFERDIIERYRTAGWWCYRTGSSSSYLPDVLAINDIKGELVALEAKSGTSDHLYVGWDQISRNIFVAEGFKRYPERKVVLAFKFLSKRKNREGGYATRELKEYFKLFSRELYERYKGKVISCHYGRGCPELPDYIPPFKIKQNKKSIN
jgi:Holliday junction resolvase